MSQRPTKMLRLNYWRVHPDFAACIAVLAEPAEVRIQASEKGFISVMPDSITLAGGFPSVINVQGLPGAFKFAGMLKDQTFPMQLIPSTMATPIPRQTFSPPFKEQIKTLKQLAGFASGMVA